MKRLMRLLLFFGREVVIVVTIFLCLPYHLYAASITLTSDQTSLTGIDPEFTVQSSLSLNAPNGTEYYLRGVFYKHGTTNYCGYTWNGTTWFKGPYSTNESWKNFLKVSITDDAWKGELKAKLDTQESGCQESGTYGFKIQRFTAKSSAGTFDEQEEYLLTVLIPTPTPTAVPTPTATPTPTPTKIPIPTSDAGVAVLGKNDQIQPTGGAKKVTPSPFSPSYYPEIAFSTKAATVKEERKEKTLVKDISEIQSSEQKTHYFFIGGAFLLMSCAILIFLIRKKTVQAL